MIKTENGSVQMMGNLAEIMTDMTLVIKAFRSGVSKKYGEIDNHSCLTKL